LEGLDPLEVFAVLVVEQVAAFALAVPRIEAVVPQHVEPGERQVVLADVVDASASWPHREVHGVEAAALARIRRPPLRR
jgi:hypothetical protein